VLKIRNENEKLFLSVKVILVCIRILISRYYLNDISWSHNSLVVLFRKYFVREIVAIKAWNIFSDHAVFIFSESSVEELRFSVNVSLKNLSHECCILQSNGEISGQRKKGAWEVKFISLVQTSNCVENRERSFEGYYANFPPFNKKLNYKIVFLTTWFAVPTVSSIVEILRLLK